MKLTKELISTAEKLIAAGNYTNVVCVYLNIDESTWYKWIDKAKTSIEGGRDNIYVQFFKSIKKAEAQAEMRNVNIIQVAAKNTWQAAAWYLERKHKDRWALKQPQYGGNEGGENGNIADLVSTLKRGVKND